MKNCPNCQEEVEDSFDICWNCNYSFPDKQVMEFPQEEHVEMQKLKCLRCCETEMVYSGEYKFHEGFEAGILGNLFELFQNKKAFDLYVCPKCGKVEFFTPVKGRV